MHLKTIWNTENDVENINAFESKFSHSPLYKNELSLIIMQQMSVCLSFVHFLFFHINFYWLSECSSDDFIDFENAYNALLSQARRIFDFE